MIYVLLSIDPRMKTIDVIETKTPATFTTYHYDQKGFRGTLEETMEDVAHYVSRVVDVTEKP